MALLPDLDHCIHRYHRQAQELFAFINWYYPSNSRLKELLELIIQEERGEWRWEPRTKLEDSAPSAV